MAALEDQLASALLADLTRPRGRPLAVEAAQLPGQLHAPFPVKIVPTAACQEVHWGAQSPFQPQADQKGYPPVTQTTVCAGRGVVTHAVSCDANCQTLPQSTTLDAVPAAAADALLLAAAAADTQLHADAAAGVQLRAVAAAAAVVAASGLIVAVGGTGGGTSQGWLGNWQIVAGRRGHAWAGGFGAAGRGQQQQQTLQGQGSGLELAQKRAAAGRRDFLKGPQATWLQHSTR